MHGFIRQLFDYDGSNLFPRTRPDAFVSCLYNSNAVGIRTIGELIDTSVPDTEPEFIYRLNGTWDGVEPDASGMMYASKLTDIPGLDFSAVLKNDLTVTNIVGIAGRLDNPNCPGGTYIAGTPLETVIIDILTKYDDIKDVKKYDSSCHFTVLLGGNDIIGGSVHEFDEGIELNLDYSFIYYDGSFGPTAGYTNFSEMNSTGINAQHFRNGVLWADSSITEIKVTEGNSTGGDVVDRHQNPECNYDEYPVITWTDVHTLPEHTSITVKPGTKIYKFWVYYTPSELVPKKSNGENSSVALSAIPKTFEFTIIGINAKDVIAIDPSVNDPILSIGQNGADVIVTSGYDLQHPDEPPTGIWVGDDVSISTTHNFLRNITDGYYSPSVDYDVNLFNTNNNVNNGMLDASNIVVNVKCSVNNNLATNVNSYEWPVDGEIGHVNRIKIKHSESYSSVGDITPVSFYINYANSLVIPKKSNGEDSSVRVPDGSLVISGSFNASVDKDVNKYTPVLSISNVSIGGVTYSNNNVVSGYYIGDTVDGSVKVVYKDGRFSPKSGYNDSSFDSNNPGSYIENNTHYHNADCNISSLNICINSASSTPIVNPQVGTAYYDFTGTFVATQDNPNGEFTIKIMGGHTVSNYTPKKLSNRPSDVSIAANTAMSSNLFTLKADTLQQQYHFYVLSVPTENSSIASTYSNVYDLVHDSNTVIHWQDVRTDTPNPISGSGVNGVGANFYTVIAIAPDTYNNFDLILPGNTHLNWNNDYTTTMNYSGNDNTQYRVFIDGRGGSGYNFQSMLIH